MRETAGRADSSWFGLGGRGHCRGLLRSRVGLFGALLGVAALLGSGLLSAASQGQARHGSLFRETNQIGDFFVVAPLAGIAVACTITAWGRTARPARSRPTTFAATIVTPCLVLVSLAAALIAIQQRN